MGLFGSNNGNAASLTPPGIGGGISQDQMQLFANAANQSGLTSMAMQQVDQMTGGMKNEDQVQMFYHLMAAHPNEVSLFFLHYPDFMKEFAALIALVVRKELYEWFNSGAIAATVNAEKAAPWASITQENLDLQIGKVVPLQQMQNEVNQQDMQAMNLMNGHQQQQMMGNMQQQQMMQQQQWQQQQMMQQQMPQRQGLSGALGSFGSNLIRGSLGLPPAQQQMPMQGQMPMYNQQLPSQ
tara:strand:- start:1601 stop:2317 length:717 start_codon:yes stop_codon:yes gene_type:complete